jgi:GT2 family glycosyltransferase
MENWEAIVTVREGETDGTTGVCKHFEKTFKGVFRFLRLRAEEGKRLNKSCALNLGIASARGDVLAMTDDDVLCAPDYIRGIQAVFSRYSVAGAQGRVLLDCDGGLPRWVFPGAAIFMSSCDEGDEVKEWTHSLFGANMVVRTEAARAVGGFAPELGPGGAGFAEDTEFGFRLLKQGYKLIYAPQILIRHKVPRPRLTRNFFRKRFFGLGRSHAYYIPLVEAPLWRFGLYAAKHLVLSEANAWWRRLRGRTAQALACECDALEQAGFFWQHWRFRTGVPRRLSRTDSWSAEAGLHPRSTIQTSFSPSD